MKVKHLLIGVSVTALLATSAVSVAAQPGSEEPQLYFIGEVDHDGQSNPSWQSGTFTEPCLPTGERMDAVVDDLYFGGVIDATDPRISGARDMVLSQTACWHEQGWPLGFAIDATWRISNEDGSWSGNGPGFISLELDDPDRPGDAFMATLTGDGDYEGLTAVVLQRRESRPNEEPPWVDVVEGIIVSGLIPPTSDFEGSEAARAWMAENLVDVHDASQDNEGEGPEDFEAQGVGVVLAETIEMVVDAYDGDVDGGAGTLPEGLGMLIEGALEDEEGVAWAERMMDSLDAIGVAPEDTTAHEGGIGGEGDDGEWRGLFEVAAGRYIGADPDALAEWFHPDNEAGASYVDERSPGTVSEELQIGEHLVFATYLDGAPMYTLIEGEVVLELFGSEGPGSHPDEAAVQAFFEALPNLAEIDYEELMSDQE